MRRLVLFLVLTFALAAPAAARDGRITVVEPAKAGVLRGPLGVAPAAPEEQMPVLPPPVLPTAFAPTPTDPSRCRVQCSRVYYVCLAGEDERCPQEWSRCVSGCGS